MKISPSVILFLDVFLVVVVVLDLLGLEHVELLLEILLVLVPEPSPCQMRLQLAEEGLPVGDVDALRAAAQLRLDAGLEGAQLGRRLALNINDSHAQLPKHTPRPANGRGRGTKGEMCEIPIKTYKAFFHNAPTHI